MGDDHGCLPHSVPPHPYFLGRYGLWGYVQSAAMRFLMAKPLQLQIVERARALIADEQHGVVAFLPRMGVALVFWQPLPAR
jgi:hypothetical protein